MPTLAQLLSYPAISLIIGSIVTWLAAWYYYKRAGDELRAEAKALHMATGAIIYFLEHPGAKIEVQRDNSGRVTGLVVVMSGHASMSFTASGSLGTSTRASP
jgi:hypothetical protein